MKSVRIAVGLAFWCGLGGLFWMGLTRLDAGDEAAGRPLANLWDYYTSNRRLEMRLPPDLLLVPGDPVLAADSQGTLQQVGIVLQVSEDGRSAQAVLFPSAAPPANLRAYHLSSPDSIEWVVRTLLPPARRKQIEDELAAAIREHHQEIIDALAPVVENGVRDAFAVLQRDLPRAVEHHRPQIQALAARYQVEIVKGELGPLVKDQVWPIVRRDSEATARQVGAELWERVSVWSFAWRGMLDRLPLVRGRDRVQMELQRFVDQEAAPILQSHIADFQDIVIRIVRDVADNDNVRAGFRHSFARAARDPELRRLVNSILQEAVVKNPRFWTAVRSALSSPEAEAAFRLTGDRLEPTVRRLGDLILGTREQGLTPEFTRVLRHQVLLKDRAGIIIGDLPPADPPLPGTPIEVWFSDSPVPP